jgi:hypothetical protein
MEMEVLGPEQVPSFRGRLLKLPHAEVETEVQAWKEETRNPGGFRCIDVSRGSGGRVGTTSTAPRGHPLPPSPCPAAAEAVEGLEPLPRPPGGTPSPPAPCLPPCHPLRSQNLVKKIRLLQKRAPSAFPLSSSAPSMAPRWRQGPSGGN